MSSTSTSDDDNDENRLNSNESQLVAAQKSLIYKHPLFPVLVYVLERCEQATLNPPLLSSNHDEQSNNSFEQNLKIFLAKNPNLLTTIKSEHDETTTLIDNFYIDAMQVLRIHLLELDKVNDLCRDFCQRYIACLKVKLNANNIFTDDEEDDEDDDDDDDEDDDDVDAEYDDGESNIEEEFDSSEEDEQLMLNTKPIFQRKSTMLNETANQFTGQTPLSQIIGASSTTIHDSSSSSMIFDSFCTKRRKSSNNLSASKRGVLPKSATSIMRSWLFQHIVHPYPTEDEKRAISQKTNLSLLQVNNWFINARRRILQPMLEASNPDLAANKKKKRSADSTTEEQSASQNRQMSNINRYWPSNLVQFDINSNDQRKK